MASNLNRTPQCASRASNVRCFWPIQARISVRASRGWLDQRRAPDEVERSADRMAPLVRENWAAAQTTRVSSDRTRCAMNRRTTAGWYIGFDCHECSRYIPRNGRPFSDTDGLEMPDLAAASKEAIGFARDMMLMEPARRDWSSWTVRVTVIFGSCLAQRQFTCAPRLMFQWRSPDRSALHGV